MRRTSAALLMLTAVAATVAGCGGSFGGLGTGSDQATFRDPSETPSNNIAVGQADFVGWGACRACHEEIYQELRSATSPRYHGANFRDVPDGEGRPSEHDRDLISGSNGTYSCAPCHTVGWDEATGYNASGTPGPVELEGIQCEECHGPGSLHDGDETKINRVPDAQETCWDCHVQSYKQLDSPLGPRTDADLSGTKPSSVRSYHNQALVLTGDQGYEYPGKTYYNGAHLQISNTCVTCHLQNNPPSTDTGHISHKPSDLHWDNDTCASCHPGGAVRLQREFREEINELLIELGGEDPSEPGEPDSSAAGGLLAQWASDNGIDINSNANASDPAVKAYKAARWNFSYVLIGCPEHNPPYVEALLEDSIESLQP